MANIVQLQSELNSLNTVKHYFIADLFKNFLIFFYVIFYLDQRAGRVTAMVPTIQTIITMQVVKIKI